MDREWELVGLVAIGQLLRPKHWVKNVFVLVPLLMTPEALQAGRLDTTLWGALVFCLIASATYVLNDLMDRDADRRHPVKRHRPIASGVISPAVAWRLVIGLAGTGLTLAFTLSSIFGLIATGYFALTTAYSVRLKHVSILDIMILAAGFIFRLEAGAVLAQLHLSVWIIVCTWLLALFLAIAKRRDDLIQGLGESHRGSLDGYTIEFVDKVMVTLSTALFVCYTIYTTDKEVMERLGTHHLYLTVPFVLAGVLRYLQITIVERRSGSPTDLSLSDRFLLLSVSGWAVVFGGLLYL